MSAPRLLVMSLGPCKCASNSRAHASGKSRRRRSKHPTAIHRLTSGLVLCLKGLCSWSRGFRSTRYINDKHTCCASRYLLSSFIQHSIPRASSGNLLQTASFTHLEHSHLSHLRHLSILDTSSVSILSTLKRLNDQAFAPSPIRNNSSSRSLCSTLYTLYFNATFSPKQSTCVSGSFDSTTPTVAAPSQSPRASPAVAALKSKTKALRHGKDTADAPSALIQAVE
ncbi:hypothetical protein CI102_11472 [Trichoderma harzianum]|nr:hypothetical protein CI102_11472 [Trichoderma harzianum]